MEQKIIIYQILPRLFGNDNSTNKQNGTLKENEVGKFSDFNKKALGEITKMGFSHIWYTGVLEHATKTDYSKYKIAKDNPAVIKGNAGSPYAIKDYYDVCPDLATKVEDRRSEFKELIDRTHLAGLKVIIDFVPNHVARQYKSDSKPRGAKDFGASDNKDHAFDPNNNFYYIPDQALELQFDTEGVAYHEVPAKVTGNDCFTNRPSKNDWYETVKLNYGVDYCGGHQQHFNPIPNTWLKMRNILLYWVAMGVDGFRCDMAEMVPVEFWRWVIGEIKEKREDVVFIAEVYNPNEYRNYIFEGGFDYLYDKVDLYDTLKDVICGHRPTSDITFAWQKVEGIQEKMLNFLENHDEQRIASDFFARNPFAAIPAMQVSTFMSTNPIMVYSGQELGERGMDSEGFSGLDGRTTIFDYWSVDSIRRWRNAGKFGEANLTDQEKKLRKLYVDTLQIAKKEQLITSGVFYDLMYANYENPQFDSTKLYAFLRSHGNEFLLVVSNFSEANQELMVSIPPEAYDFMEINTALIKKGKELYTKKDILIDNPNKISLHIDGFSGVVIKFVARKSK